MPTPELVAGLLAKVIGSLAGALMALAILPPKTAREFMMRLAVSGAGGFIGAPVLIAYFEWPGDGDFVLASSAIAAFVTWWLGGAIIRAARNWTPPPKA